MKTIIYMVGYDQTFQQMCNSGWGCGYVMIPVEHPVAKGIIDSYNNYAEERPEEFNYMVDHASSCLDAPGGITYAEFKDTPEGRYLVVGFDTAHSWDTPANDFNYVFEHTRALQKEIEDKG
jgi:hypothetical protein